MPRESAIEGKESFVFFFFKKRDGGHRSNPLKMSVGDLATPVSGQERSRAAVEHWKRNTVDTSVLAVWWQALAYIHTVRPDVP